MVTATESNRTQASATPSFEPQAQGLQPPPEAAVDRPEAERLSLAVRDPFWFVSFVVAGATITSMCGLSTLILAILGLSGVSSMYMLPVASIALGLAFLTLGTVGNAWARIFQFAEHGGSRDRVVFHSGVAATLIAGLAATVLGILNFAFLGDMWFVAVAVIALGLGLLWHSRVMWRVSHFTYYVTYHGVEGSRPSGPFAINALSQRPCGTSLWDWAARSWESWR